jgi:uncharacterized protein YcfL
MWQKLSRWASAIAFLIIGVLGIMRGFNAFTLPSCTSDTTIDTIKSIFKDKKVDIDKISDPSTVTDTSSEKTCKAHVDAPREQAMIDYKVYWEGWTVKVMITNVDSKPI